jgi:hypothetical protein
MTKMEVTMETQDGGREFSEGVHGLADQAESEAPEAAGHVREMADGARRRAGEVADRLPGAFSHVRAGAENAVTRLQTLPDSGLRLLAAVSLGLGAGLRLAGAPRLVTLTALAPASVLGFAIVSRPSKTLPELHPSRP